MTQTTVDSTEVSKFAQHANIWWDQNGPLKTLHDLNPLRLKFIEETVKLRNERILDVGCGGGILSESLALLGGIVTGIDAEPLAIATAKDHATKSGLEIEYYATPIESFDKPVFPIVTCMELLEHVRDPQEMIHHLARCMSPGGWLFLSTINRTARAYASVIFAAEYVLNLLPRQTHDYKKFIKPSELACMARFAGLELISVRGVSYHPFTRQAALQDTVHANYIMVCRKEG